MAKQILALHPDGKRGVNINRQKYDTMREAILGVIGERGEMTLTELIAALDDRLGSAFDGSIEWYATTVKLDLEARGELKRVDQRVRLA